MPICDFITASIYYLLPIYLLSTDPFLIFAFTTAYTFLTLETTHMRKHRLASTPEIEEKPAPNSRGKQHFAVDENKAKHQSKALQDVHYIYNYIYLHFWDEEKEATSLAHSSLAARMYWLACVIVLYYDVRVTMPGNVRSARWDYTHIGRYPIHIRFMSTYEGGPAPAWQYLISCALLTCSCYISDLRHPRGKNWVIYTILCKFRLKLREAGCSVLNAEAMGGKLSSSQARQNENTANERKTQMNLDIFYSLNTSTFICPSICLALLLLRPLYCWHLLHVAIFSSLKKH